ncbi:ribulose-phosphate 3-epimerase [Candidatus Daviesbacteria bacterium]|nr:ribulose-phosphate 3-epimerase [Candidatus Daviesbacteria bacterium]
MVQIIPAILDKTSEDFEKHINQLKGSEAFKEGWVHFDFADNEFVPNHTIGIDMVKQFPISLKKEAHLMVAHPLEWVEGLKKAEFDRVIFHFESKDDIQECIKEIKNLGMEVGIALNNETKIEKLEPFQDKIDLVLIMAIVPGFQGQPFLPHSLEKIKKLKEKNWPVGISVDGAIRDENAKQFVEAGVDYLVIGSFLLKGYIDENVEKIWEAINS